MNGVLKKSSDLSKNYLTVKLSTPTKIVANQWYTNVKATLSVTCKDRRVGLGVPLNTSDFTSVNDNLVRIIDVSHPSKTYLANGSISYIYTITLQIYRTNYPKTTNITLNGNLFNIKYPYISSQYLSCTNKPLNSYPITLAVN